MINSKFWKMIVAADLNFSTTPFVSGMPTQDSDTAQILLMGGLGCNNRRKQGVAGSLDTTIVT
jgi:hypothetical protein